MNVLVGLLVMATCLFVQAILVVIAFRYYTKRFVDMPHNGLYLKALSAMCVVMLFLVFGNLLQVSIWAGVTMWLGEFTRFEHAFYHAAVNFSTLGYGDVLMSEQHRVLGPLAAINGVLMIGVSTGVLMATFQDLLSRKRKHGEN